MILALNKYRPPSNNGGIVLYQDAEISHMENIHTDNLSGLKITLLQGLLSVELFVHLIPAQPQDALTLLSCQLLDSIF